MLVYIIGFMGSGKSSLGKSLAESLNFDFIDSDCFIENREGISVVEIFKQKGESYFRKAESDALSYLSHFENTIISTGGGMPCYEDNIKVIKESGISIYLEVDIDILTHRLENEKDKRPLISNYNSSEIKSYIEIEFNKRKAIYEQADIHINNSSLNIEESVQLIEQKINYHTK